NVVDPVREARVWVGSQQLQHQPDQHQTLDNAEHQIDELDGAPARVDGADHLGFGWCLGTFAHHPLAVAHLTARRITFEFGVPTLHFVLPSALVVKRRESGYAGNARGHSGTRAPGGRLASFRRRSGWVPQGKVGESLVAVDVGVGGVASDLVLPGGHVAGTAGPVRPGTAPGQASPGGSMSIAITRP